LSCEKKEESKSSSQGSLWGPCYEDGTCKEGLVCKDNVCWPDTGDFDSDEEANDEEVIPDEEGDSKPAEEGTITPDNDGDITDTLPDSDSAAPCDAHPCTAVEHSDGTCTNDGDTYICGCEIYYEWDPAEKTCVPLSWRADCTNTLPPDAHWAPPNEDGKFEQTWDGDSWEPAAFACAWECNENYTKVSGSCVADTRRVDCTNIPDNAHGIGINSDGKFEQVWDGDSWEPETFECAWECSENYTRNENECAPNTRRIPCTNTLPEHSHYAGMNADGMFEQVWDGDSWEPETFECAWECSENYTRNDTECAPDTRRIPCTNTLPEHSHYAGMNADGMFEQVWDGDSWKPETFECQWTCNENYTRENNECRGSVRRTSCLNIPPNAHGTGDNSDGMFEQVWDGDSWEPATFACAWECNENYLWDEWLAACMPQTRRVDCINIPPNAHGTGINADGKFQQTWGQAGWEPLPEEVSCTWECDEHYQQENGSCEPETRVTTCTNPLPSYARWSGSNAGGTITQTWNGSDWEPPADSCEWECEEGYHRSGEICEDNTRRVPCLNIPMNAHGTGENADNMFEQVWTDEGWEPETVSCTWECDRGYSLSLGGESCVLRQVVFVNLNATGANDGTAWEDAFTDLSDALETAIPGQEIWVAAGTYHPTRCATIGSCEPRRRHFILKKGIALYGGFAGTETERDERDWVVHETILSGDFNGDDVWDDLNHEWLNRAENAIHVLIATDSSSEYPAILDGFTIEGGHADDRENSEIDGGGIRLSSETAPFIRNCLFRGNVADSSGGAIFVPYASPTIENCTFVGNSSYTGGAIWVGWSSGVVIANSLFEGNFSFIGGGALLLQDSAITIEETTFVANYSTKGGALYNYRSHIHLINCVFAGNTSNEWGGAVLLFLADPFFINCTFSGNTDSAGNDGIVFIQSYATFDNTILWDEVSQILEIGKEGNIVYFDPSNPVFRYSNVYQSGGSLAWALPFGTDGGGNIDADPLFVGSGDDPLSLQDTSPCINAGNNSLVPPGIEKDITGGPRIKDGTVDMGAYEK